jgi:NAD(P)-dependent dehydrogenase (short-subunit alcohol dehydrogenase family)
MHGQHILITGGTGGLGSAVTRQVLHRGGQAVVPYLTPDAGERLKASLPDDHIHRLRLFPADLTDEATVISLVADMPRIDALIHLVGGFAMGDTVNYTYRAWKQDFELNVNTTFLLAKHCLKRMQAQNYGRIVTVGSRGAVIPSGKLAAYCAAKAAVVAFTQSIADEMKGTNITANSVLPSVIDTPANRAAMGPDQAQQWVQPASLSEVICFLASKAAKDVRGAAVPVYGDA